MVAKKTFAVSITIRPVDGINQNEVAKFSRWVADMAKELSASGAVLHRPGTPAQHLHCGLLFQQITTGDAIRKRMKDTLFKTEIAEDTRWSNLKVALVCKAHDNFRGLVGGYFHHEAAEVLFMTGISKDELAAGAADYEKGKAKKAKQTCSRTRLISHMLDEYVSMVDINRTLPTADQEDPPDAIQCFQRLLRQGYVNYLLHWPAIKKTVVEQWSHLVASRHEEINEIIYPDDEPAE